MLSHFSLVWHFSTLWTIAYHGPLSLGLSRILEWVAMPSFRGTSQPRGQTNTSCVSCIAGRFFTPEPLGMPGKLGDKFKYLVTSRNPKQTWNIFLLMWIGICRDQHSFTPNLWKYTLWIGLPRWLSGKEFTASVGDMGLIPGLGRSPGGRNGNTLQYSCLENPMDRGASLAIVYRVAKSRKQQNTHMHTVNHQHCPAKYDKLYPYHP